MIVPALLLIGFGLYGVLFSGRISERARRDKWPAGGNRVFTIIASIVVFAFGSHLLQSIIDQWLDAESGAQRSGWVWFWFAGGIFLVLLGAYMVIRSERIAEKALEVRKSMVVPMAYPGTKRQAVIHGAIYMVWGATWISGSWPW